MPREKFDQKVRKLKWKRIDCNSSANYVVAKFILFLLLIWKLK